MKTLSLALLTLPLLACSTDATPSLPADFDPDAEIATDSKSDRLTRWYTEMVGEISLGESVEGTTTTPPLHGRTLQLQEGDRISLSADGSYWGFLAVYGPQRNNGRWGRTLQWDYIRPNTALNTYTGAYNVDIDEDGDYLIVIGSFWSNPYRYNLNVDCLDGSCAQTFCVTYQTPDNGEAHPSNYYATNVDSYPEGVELLARISNAINGNIEPGGCSELSAVCTKQYQPVCSGTLTPEPVTYGNLCALQVFVRQYAGTTSAAKAHWENGECAVVCTTEYAPVCGVDGVTYSNQCVLDQAGAQLDYAGECTATSCGARAGDTCSSNEYCAYEAGQYCGAADAQSTCQERPEVCLAVYQPVCGCDGQTYSNGCRAAAAGTGVLRDGPCEVNVVGDWSGAGPLWDVQFNLASDGRFIKSDLVAPCDTGAVCFWSGIVTNTGTYAYDSFANVLHLTYETNNNFGGDVLFPATLTVSSNGIDTTLTESIPAGGSIEYAPI